MKLIGIRSVAALALVAPMFALASPAVAVPEAPAGTGGAVPFAPTAGDVVGGGTWSVASVEGGYAVSWTADTVLPMGADRPTILLDGVAVGTTSLVADGRTVEAFVAGDREPAVSDLDVMLSGRALDEASPTIEVGPSGSFAPGSQLLPQDPAAPGPHAVVSSDYVLPSLAVPGLRKKVEMVGHVEAPAPGAATGQRPLVLFLHGRHSVCYNPDDPEDWGGSRWPCRAPRQEIPSHLGYRYVQERLASQGYTTVSVRVNGINAQDWNTADGGADARARVVRAHLDHWAGLAAAEQVDLDRVVLVGHSRGGEGVNRAAIQIPLSAPYRIAGQVLIAPTDFGFQSAPYIPTVTVLPSCDGDVSDLQGQRFTDLSRGLIAGDTSLKSSVFVQGANHNYFNTEWTPGTAAAPSWDDWGGSGPCGESHPDRLTPAEQRDSSIALVAGAVDVFTRDDERFLGLFDGEDVRVASTGDTATRSHALGGGRQTLRPGLELQLAAAPGSATLCRGVAFGRSGCGKDVRAVAPHWIVNGEAGPRPSRAVSFAWSSAGSEGHLALGSAIDLTGHDLELRTVVDQRFPSVGLRVRLTDASGASALLTPRTGATTMRLPRAQRGQWWAQTLTVDPGAAAIDLSAVTGIDLVATSAAGGVFVLDASVTPSALAPVPATRAATVSFGSVEVPEGDAGGEVEAELPVTITGTLESAATLRVLTFSETSNSEWRTMTIHPGQTSASIPFTFTSDDRYGGYNRAYNVAGYLDGGVATDAYIGQLTVVEDDPLPRMKVSVVRPLVTEGDDIVVRVRLSEPMATLGWFDLGFVKTPGRYLLVKDVRFKHPKQFKADKPLWVYRSYAMTKMLRSGRSTFDFVLPTRIDRVREGIERAKVRVTFNTDSGPVRREVLVRVKDRARR